jgi:RNA-directed DNA polymerase
MYVLEESDCAIVPRKLPNKEAKASSEAAEGRARTKENDVHHHTYPTQSGVHESQGLGGVRRTAQARKQERFTALLHHLSSSYCGKATMPSSGMRLRKWTA